MSQHRAAAAARATARTTARTTVRTAGAARRHPREAVSVLGIAAVAASVLGVVLAVRVVRSRRFRRGVTASAKRGTFGPGVAAATSLAEQAAQARQRHDRSSETPSS